MATTKEYKDLMHGFEFSKAFFITTNKPQLHSCFSAGTNILYIICLQISYN